MQELEALYPSAEHPSRQQIMIGPRDHKARRTVAMRAKTSDMARMMSRRVESPLLLFQQNFYRVSPSGLLLAVVLVSST